MFAVRLPLGLVMKVKHLAVDSQTQLQDLAQELIEVGLKHRGQR